MRRSFLAASLLGVSGALLANVHAVDIASFGNQFSVFTEESTTTVVGFNGAENRIYEIRHYADGSYEGLDADGHHFVGDATTGYFLNTGTGRYCYGLGEDRRCSN